VTDIVVFSLERWDGVWRRNQHIVHRLIRNDPALRVLFVEPPRDPLHELRSRRPPHVGSGLRIIDGYDGRLLAYEPTKWLPRAAPGGLAALEREARRGIRAAAVNPDVMWVNAPQWARYATEHAVPTIYDITDDWTLAKRGRRSTDVTIQDDRRLIQRSDAVVVCSTQLQTSKGAIRAVNLIPNAVDLDAYRVEPARPSELPAGPVALYAGTLHEDRLDVSLTATLADSLESVGASLVLVGPDALSSRSREILGAKRAITWVGAVDSVRVPSFLMSADVLIVPHVVTPFTESLDPIKLYEYLAARRPIVSTPVAGFRDHPGVTVPAEGEFARVVADLAAPRRRSETRVDMPDWAARAAAFREVIDSVLATSGATGEPA
jgi:teichuronic acid biosynthesis glycosyltransferase TuaH